MALKLWWCGTEESLVAAVKAWVVSETIDWPAILDVWQKAYHGLCSNHISHAHAHMHHRTRTRTRTRDHTVTTRT